MGVLGSMILSPHAVNECAAMLTPDDFWRPAHKIMFAALAKFAGSDTDVDFIVLKRELGKEGLLNVGGEDYLIQVAEFVPSCANAGYYARIVKDCSARRTMAAQSKELHRLAMSTDVGIDEVRAFAQSISEAPHQSGSAFVNLADVEIGDDGDTGVATGFDSLDAAISTKGFPSGQMTMIRAYHKGGKTTFMVSAAVRAAEAGRRVLYVTLADLDDRQIKRRIMRMLTSWSKRPTIEGQPQKDFDTAVSDIEQFWNFTVYDAGKIENGDAVETVVAWVTAKHKEDPFDVIFIDYAQELTSSDRKASTEVSEQNICAHKINRMARRLSVPVVVGSQITEGAEGQKAKTKYSRSWEEKAGWVLTLERTTETQVKCEISYSRFGPQGKVVPLTFDQVYLSFFDSFKAAQAAA
jgi:replicative DNA helicase